MTPSARGLTANEVLAFLEQRKNAGAPVPIPMEKRRAFQEAAAVLVTVDDPKKLRPIGGRTSDATAVRIVEEDFVPASGSRLGKGMMLAPKIRRAVLKELADSGRLKEALESNAHERTGELQAHFERYLRGTAPPVKDQSLEQLEMTQQVMLWAGDSLTSLPSSEEVQERAALLRLMAPFEAIAGDAVFRGRKSELDTLRLYVGVRPPESRLRNITNLAIRWIEPERQPAVSISGPGGVGKSALIGRFMLEHTRLPEEERVPFAYLDFDRPALEVTDLVGLCFEMVRQIDTQFPGDNRFGRLRESVETATQPVRADPEAQLASARSVLADLLGLMRKNLGPRPFILVLDTFEEVQYRGETRAHPLWNLLSQLQGNAPWLRVVISGRAPVTSLLLAGKEPNQLPIGDLEIEAALSWLQEQGVKDRQLGQRLVKAYGGVPLSLKLIAALASDPETFRGVPQRGFLSSVPDEIIQGQLYDRILNRIRDERVRRLAHPGLVLRRINPEIILTVLNTTCELGLSNSEEANALFNELRRETALVTTDDSDGDLVHRADLRRIMLKLLVQSEPARVQQIRESAAAWYATQRGRRARAEMFYHLLHLGHSVSPTDLLDSEIRLSIQSAVSEFTVEVQLYLSGLGFQVPKEVLEQGSLQQQDDSLCSQVEDLLPFGKSSEADARGILQEVMDGLDRPSPLWRAAARLAAQQGRNRDALSLIDKGTDLAIGSGLTRLTLDLTRDKAWLLRQIESRRLPQTLVSLNDLAGRHQDVAAMLQYRLQLIENKGDGANTALAGLGGFLSGCTPAQLWDVAPGFLVVLDNLAAEDSDRARMVVVEQLLRLVLGPESPFRYAVFSDYEAQKRLDAVHAAADKSTERFAAAYAELCRAWPYRILGVRPPYGRRGEQLTEAV